MKLLLDTHIFLWFISGDARLRILLRDAIRNSDNEVFLSVVSFWEIVVKHNLGKLPLPQPPEIFIPRQRRAHQIKSLFLTESNIKELVGLPLLHRDPFDRMLICQALSGGFTIVTVDPAIKAYSVSHL